ncbi:MAG: hypothetical protein QM674_08155 [Burkholderiaceae bacterium]
MIEREQISFPATLFVSYLSCVEERRYCEHPEEICEVLLEEELPLFKEALHIYEECYATSWQKEVLKGELLQSKGFEVLRQAKAVQLVLYFGATEYLTKKFNIRQLSGYSIGYAAVFAAVETMKPRDLLNILPINRDYALNNIKIWETGEYHSILLCSYDNAQFSREIRELVTLFLPKILVRDDRHPYAVQCVGSRSELEHLRDLVFARFEAETTSSSIIKADGSHLWQEKYPAIREVFESFSFSAPKIEISTHVDGILKSGMSALEAGRVLFNCVQAPLSMGTVNERLRGLDLPVLYVGSERTARFVFYGFGPAKFAKPCFHWEQSILTGTMEHSMSLPQESLLKWNPLP